MANLATFDAGYGRAGAIWTREGNCDVCHRGPLPVIAVDNSEGEYRTGYICQECASKAFSDGVAVAPAPSEPRCPRCGLPQSECDAQKVGEPDGFFAEPTPGAQACPRCDDTGDVHDATGEWRGRCTCPAGVGGNDGR
jgi:hypothetical protein